MDSQNILPVQQTNVTGTSAVVIIPASGNVARYRHLVSLIITTLNAAVATITISDGSKTVAVLNFPSTAAVPTQPFVFQPTNPIAQSQPNLAWTMTVSANTGGCEVTAQYVEN
jgi:hypothetical protein